MTATIPAPASTAATSMESPPERSNSRPAKNAATSTVAAPDETSSGRPAAKGLPIPKPVPPLVDPTLALAADVLDDLETVRIANENRLRQLTRSVEDSDGETRGFGLDESHPDVARLAAIVTAMVGLEKDAARNLEKALRRSPLHPWIKAQRGLGDKQVARLLAAIGDPYIRPEIVREDGTVEPSRPRTVSELWAYSGYHTISGRGQALHDTQAVVASAGFNIAPKRAKGSKSNWSETARKRCWLISNSIVKAGGPYREVYDATRVKYAEATHAAPCVRCGPSGKPAPEGSPLSDGHKHARALRAVSKTVLRDLWREARRLHES